MKKTLIVLLFIFVIIPLVFITIGKFSYEPEAKYESLNTKYAKTSLNVRKYPKIKGEVLKVLSANEKVIVYDSVVNGFVLLLNSDSTKYGWASKNYLQSKELSKSQLQKNLKQQEEIATENKKKKETNKLKTKNPSMYLSDAKYYAHERVLKLLKSPSTADFGLWDEQAFSWNDGTYYGYKIKGYVDSQNGFGATLRTYYTVNVGKNAKGEVATSTPILK